MKFDHSAVGGRLFVIVPKDFKHGKSTLHWVLQNVAKNGDRLVIVHSHGCHEQTSPEDSVEELHAYYVAMCREWKCVVLLIKDDDVVEGLLRNHIELKDITNLVVGVEADDERYSEIITSLNSKTAIQPMQTTAPPCKIWFITCNRDLTCTSHLLPRSNGDFWIRSILQMSGNNHRFPLPRELENDTGADANIRDRLASVLDLVERKYDRKFQEASLKRSNLKKERASPVNSPNRHSLKSPSRHAKEKEKEKICQRELQDAKDEMSHLKKQIKETKTVIKNLKQNIQELEAAVTEASLKRSNLKKEASLKRSNLKKERASPVNSPNRHSLKSPSRQAKEKEKEKICQRELQDAKDEISHLKKQIKEMKTAIKNLKQIIQEPEVAVTEASLKRSNLKKEASLKRSNLKKERASPVNSPNRHSLKSPSGQAKEKEKEKICQRELQDAKDEMSHLKKQIKEMKTAIKNLKQIIQEPEAAVTEAGGLYEKNEQQSAMTLPAETVNTEFSKDEIDESLKRLDNALIGKGRSGSVYKGLLHNTTVVAIKMLDRESMQGESDFIQKVGVLGRVRHQNLVTLIGICTEVFGLVYEFLPNGSLQDRLECRNGMPPLIWQVRTKIIREICRVLIFLHSNKPQPVVHGNLKPSKILLDDYNFACKLEAFGISQSKGTQHDDVHSFGIIVLQLLTGSSSPEKVLTVVDEAMKKGEKFFLHTVLDHTAGDWPDKLPIQLARMGLLCARLSREERPDILTGENVWKVLESAAIVISNQDDDDEDAAPEYFKCPLSKGVMRNPHFAADGYTYEHEEFQKWVSTSLGAQHSTSKVVSPVLHKELKSFELTPNWPLNSEIQGWRLKHPRQVSNVVSDPPNPVQSSQQGHPNTSAASAPSPRLNPLPAIPSVAAPPPPRPVTPPSTFLPPPTGIHRRRINGRLPSLSTEADVPGPGESSRIIPGKFKHE
ncbi:unnamed protein product [Urochloa decumbens]|uniref:RING-type E3 ubiquitin transferase n=1 Tax=Urochloa decumbens TaxID=240449 RepID=A0ABC9G803_9POAL